MSNYVIRVYGAKIAGSYQLQKEEGFIDFNTEFFKKHKPLKKASNFIFISKCWAVEINLKAHKGIGRIICYNRENDQTYSLPLKDGALLLQDLGEKHTGNQRYRARLHPIKLKSYLLENYMISGTSVEDPNHKYRGEFLLNQIIARLVEFLAMASLKPSTRTPASAVSQITKI